jgi:membrane-bound lytic murein transglycosylase B
MAGIKPTLLVFAAAISLVSCAEAAALRTQSLSLWLQQTEQRALDEGISPAVVHEALDDFAPNPRVVELDQKQPESAITFKAYRHNVVTPARIRKGAELARYYGEELNALEARTGVPPQIVVALWAVESSYGRDTGDFEVVNSLATLAYEGRRADFFRNELFSALRILEHENMTPGELRGSWAGAMGQCQFMPSTYLAYAVDATGDGRRDIWNSEADVLASIANYLAAEGWQRGLTWGREVDEDTAPDDGESSPLIRPDGEEGPRFLVSDNFRALTRWNRSTYFALSVGLLADGIKASVAP